MEPESDRDRANRLTLSEEGSSHLSVEAQWWACERNVEAVWCWLPDFDQVCDGTHTVTALGNDGMAVNVLIDNEQAARAGIAGLQAQLAFLGRTLMVMRHAEAMAG